MTEDISATIALSELEHDTNAAAKAAEDRRTRGTLRHLAHEALNLCDDDTEAATDLLTKRLVSEPDLLRTVISQVIHDAVQYHVECNMRANRSRIINNLRREGPPGRESIRALAEGIRDTLLDLPLANGVRLRDATRQQVMEQAARYAAISADTVRKARFLEMIVPLVPEDRTVGDVLSIERVTELWQKAGA